MRSLEKLLRFARQDGSCWVWTGTRTSGGYGKVKRGEKTLLAHRLGYQLMIGPIPPGKQMDHLCRNRACINPLHLEPVTCRENILRGRSSQAENAAKTSCKRGHEFTAENTYHYPDGRRRCKVCRRIDDNSDGPRERRKLYKRSLSRGRT